LNYECLLQKEVVGGGQESEAELGELIYSVGS
jgi:hypothetical protein